MPLRHHLKERIPEGVTPYRIAKDAQLSTNTIYKLTADPYATLVPQVLEKLCALLECQPGDLLSYEPPAEG